ncbi:S-adenosyl-L-methionine-dependent methyltransferase [Chytridium lagenaria]|nr:S-adenosyl-L-methionine-dependent methyltransferase [Chytridium lagenaria]
MAINTDDGFKTFVVQFAQVHLDFRLPELDALAKLEGIEMRHDPSTLSTHSPFFLIKLRSSNDAVKLITRAILVKEIVELWTLAPDFPSLLQSVKDLPSEIKDPYRTVSFKFLVGAFGSTLSVPDQVHRIEQFAFLDFKGDIDLKTPDVTFRYYEDYGDYTSQGLAAPKEGPECCYFGILRATGNRSIVSKFDLKKRNYLGTTSMNAELSLIMANQGLAKEGSFVLDPFVGTGSLLVSAAHFGAFVMGSDIDGRQIRGKGDGNITSNMEQYQLQKKSLGYIVTDLAHNPWRKVPMWDAIICDPPYGVRAGARKIGINEKFPPKTSLHHADGTPKLPQTVPYELHDIILDLVAFSAASLVPGGRLVYWLPTIPDEYDPADIPSHPRLRVVANSEQCFGKWARRLVTMEKVGEEEADGEWDRGGRGCRRIRGLGISILGLGNILMRFEEEEEADAEWGCGVPAHLTIF